MDRRAVRLALGLTVAGALMLIAGVASWLITAAGRITTGLAARDLRLASLALLAGGAACGVAMGFALASAGRTRPARQPAPDGGAGLAPGVPGLDGPPLVPAPSLAEPRSLMNPPPPSPPPPLAPSVPAPSPANPGSPDRVWWRAAHSPGGGWDDTSEEWLRSLRGPVIQQPPPHSAE
jgi:hypothetical protein